MRFELQFREAEIPRWAARVTGNKVDMAREAEAFAQRDGLLEEKGASECLRKIGKWKSPRRAALLINNCPADIAEACRIALETSSAGCAIAVMQSLRGVGAPMASAILTVLDKQRYTVIDWRALEALGRSDPKSSFRVYPDYLKACRQIAERNNVGLRQLDHALWGWSKYRANPN